MNRRDFLRRASMAAAGAFVLDPEQLLYVPSRTYFDLGAKPPLVELIDPHTYGTFGLMVEKVWNAAMGDGDDQLAPFLATRDNFVREIEQLQLKDLTRQKPRA